MKKFITIICILALIISSSAQAGWLDTWYDQAVSTAPNYFEGQKRGYFTAGSFSARIPTSTDYLISIEKPRFSAGCGGIDAFLGGFSFVNFDYLVQKLQRLIQAAPAIAFKIALNTLSSMLGAELNDIEKIIDMLNSIQLNECAAMKPLMSIDLTKTDQISGQLEQAAKSFIRTGETDLWSSVQKLFSSSSDSSAVKKPSGGDLSKDETIKGCPQNVKAFLRSASLLEYLKTKYLSLQIMFLM